MSTEVIERLKELVDPVMLLSTLGFSVFYDNSEEIRCPCAIHGGDNKTAFSFRKGSRRFYCYTKGCETDASGEVNNDIISLVMKVNSCSFREAVSYLSQLTGFDVDLGDVDHNRELELRKLREKSKFIDSMLYEPELPAIDETLVAKYMSNGCDYFVRQGFSHEIIDMFELGTMYDELGVERASVPIRDEHGRLVSISGRRTDGDEEPRYLLVRNFQKRMVLYNLNRVVPRISQYNGAVIIVEGFKALWHVHGAGFPNVVAVMGSSISSDHVNLLVKYGFSCAILLLDGDKKGRLGMQRSQERMKGKINCVPVHLPNELSPDDITASDVRDLITLFL